MIYYQNTIVTGSIDVSGSLKAHDTILSGSVEISGSLLLNGLPVGGGGGTGNTTVTISGSAPSGSTTGSLWFNNTEANMYIYYQDDSGSAWVPTQNGSAIYAQTASYALRADGIDIDLSAYMSSSLTASTDTYWAGTASLAETASYVELAQTASFVTLARSASFVATASTAVSASISLTASYVNSTELALTASYLNNLTQSVNLLGNLNVIGTGSFTYISTTFETASTIYSSGSNVFGDNTNDNHQFTGSVLITGSTFTWNNNTVITTANTSSLSVTSASYAATASTLLNTVYNKEIHVSSGSGDDITGNGTLLKPYQTLAKAFSVVGGTGENVIIHPGTYRENTTVSASNVTITAGSGIVNGGIVFISGSLTVGPPNGTSIRISGVAVNNLTHTSSGSLYLDGCKVYMTYSKASPGYSEIINTQMQCPGGINVTSPGTLIIQGHSQALITVNNASAIVSVKDSVSLAYASVLAGTFVAYNSPIYPLVSGSAAIVSSAGTFVQLYTCQIQTATGIPERVNIGGFFGYDDITFNKTLSTLGTSLATKTHFQSADVNTLTATGSLFGSASYALTASYALNGGGTSGGGNTTVTISGSQPTASSASGSLWWNNNDGNLYIQTSTPTGSVWVPAVSSVAGGNYGATTAFVRTGSTWTLNHNLNTTSPIIQVYSGSSVVIPLSIDIVNANTATVTFTNSSMGTAVVSTGIGGPTSSSFAITSVSSSYALSSSFVLSSSFATTASYVKTLYANLGLNSDVATVVSGSDISWTNVTASSEVTVAGANITLPAGTYMLNGDINGYNYTNTTNGYINVNLVNSSNVVVPATTQANPGPPTAVYNYTMTGQILGLFTVPTTSTYKVRVVNANGSASLASSNTRVLITSLNI